MQSPNSLLSKFARNLFKLSHQQQQLQTLQPQWMQINCMHAITASSSYQQMLHRQQQHQNQQQKHRQQCPQKSQSLTNSFHLQSLLKYHTCCTTATISTLTYPTQQLLRSYSKFTTRPTDPCPLSAHPQPLTPERATELIASLKDFERDSMREALEKFEAVKMKENFVGKLAATQWRTRFGRPTKLPSLGDVDPTGTFCAFPDNWLKMKAVQNAKQPTKSDLWKLFMVNAVPFIGFGFLDNFTMIIAGDYIESTLGYFMTLSTMAAAGLGNTISDVLGIGSAVYVERLCEMMGLRPPDLTSIQMELKSSRRAANYGRIVGITVGCLVGMFPLIFMAKHPKDKKVAPAN